MLYQVEFTDSAPGIPDITEAEAAAMARAVVNLFARWELTDAEACELLGGLARRTWSRWKAGEIGRIDRDLSTRLSILMGIHKGLRYLFSDPARGYAWVKKPNAGFGGRRPLDVMADGSIFALMRVRGWLDAERAPW